MIGVKYRPRVSQRGVHISVALEGFLNTVHEACPGVSLALGGAFVSWKYLSKPLEHCMARPPIDEGTKGRWA